MSFPDARNCTTYDSWPYGLNNRKGYVAKVTEDQITKQFASRPTTYLIGELDISRCMALTALALLARKVRRALPGDWRTENTQTKNTAQSTPQSWCLHAVIAPDACLLPIPHCP
jgi:pyridoxine/pyridoxamine 5'-phosphate oxidase